MKLDMMEELKYLSNEYISEVTTLIYMSYATLCSSEIDN